MRVYGRRSVTGGTINGEYLQSFLLPINDPWIQERIGKENIKSQSDDYIHTLGQRYKLGDLRIQGGRLLYLFNGEVVGAVNFTKHGKLTVINNIYVRTDYRRKRVATCMVNTLQGLYPNLLVDGNMTEAGGRFFASL